MPTTSPQFTSNETSFSAQMVSLATADDWPRTTAEGGADSLGQRFADRLVARLRAADAVLFG